MTQTNPNNLTSLHGTFLGQACKRLLGEAQPGAVAFVRCLAPQVVEDLAILPAFEIESWQVFRVADSDDSHRTITADRAVEEREAKGQAMMLLVDTDRAGAGMDGIYSAAREVDEASLFKEARRLAAAEVKRRLSRDCRDYAERAIKKAQGSGRQYGVSPWTVFDFLCRVAVEEQHPGAYLHLLGLWPVDISGSADMNLDITEQLNTSRRFVDHLLRNTMSHHTIPARIESLKLKNHESEHSLTSLEDFLNQSQSISVRDALSSLANEDHQHLWVGPLRIENAEHITKIELKPWRGKNGKILKWSGLEEPDNPDNSEPPILKLPNNDLPRADNAKLQLKWKTDPPSLAKNMVDYQVTIRTDAGEELAAKYVSHSGKAEEKCLFSSDDFQSLDEAAHITAKAVISVSSKDQVEPQESEEFYIRFGDPQGSAESAGGKPVRTFSEGLIELSDWQEVSSIVNDRQDGKIEEDKKGFLVLRTLQTQKQRSFKVFRPALISQVERQWIDKSQKTEESVMGRWRIKVRTSGDWAEKDAIEFIPFEHHGSHEPAWNAVVKESDKMVKLLARCGGCGQIYDNKAKSFSIAKEYVSAWAKLLEDGDPLFTLAHTVEVQLISGRTIGLIVLPTHPLRVAWHMAYDNLILHTAFEQKKPPKKIREEFAGIDGAMFPPFLPKPDGDGTFVFADTLGFHAVGMVSDQDKEPKAAVAILSRALGESDSADTAPTVGKQSAAALQDKILKYLDCHDASWLLRVHALRAGDGLTISRSLGGIHHHFEDVNQKTEDYDDASKENEALTQTPVFLLELYPSAQQRGITGRFIAEARERRRSGAGALSPNDRWMLESVTLPGGVNIPKLRWARKDLQEPDTVAHLAIAFDMLNSQVTLSEVVKDEEIESSFHVFGLLSFYDRQYTGGATPQWQSIVQQMKNGEQHPAKREHSELLIRLQNAMQGAVAQHLGNGNQWPALQTVVSPESEDSFQKLHNLCDWVITLDRNAGIEYFDSPDNQKVYNTYVIDCVPEREDLSCLQLVTSTNNLEEVHKLLDKALDEMELSRSATNSEFLLNHLKGLSGRLAIRLTGSKTPTAELIALACSHHNCHQAEEDDECWLSLLNGFMIPVDDVRDLLPSLVTSDGDNEPQTQPDLIYVTTVGTGPRRRLAFQFAEVKYRRHLRTARAPDVLEKIHEQTQKLRKRWYEWYSHEECCSFRAIRRAKLARVLRFYADKAHRHHLPEKRYRELVSEIKRMIEKGGSYNFQSVEKGDRGWLFCPEYNGPRPLKISPPRWDTSVFIFGPDFSSSQSYRRDSDDENSEKYLEAQQKKEVPADNLLVSTATAETVNASEAPAEVQGMTDVIPSVCFGTNSYSNTETRWTLTTKGNPHLLVAGLPGMGKTSCLLNICRQMIAADIQPIIFSYHQDIDERLEELVGSVRFINFDGLGFNPLQVIDRQSSHAHLDVAANIRDIFTAIFPGLGDIQAERLRQAVKDSFSEKGWGDHPSPDVEEPLFKRFVEILRSDPKPDHGLKTLLARLGELEDYDFFSLRESQSSLWESAKPTVIRIHTTQNETLQRAFASLIFYGLYKDMFRRGVQDRITHALIFDEAHRAAKLALIPTMAKECRKYGISLVLASQEARDFHASVFSAIANYLVLRLNDTDAKALIGNVATSQQKQGLIDKIKQLDKYKALYFQTGQSRPGLVHLSP